MSKSNTSQELQTAQTKSQNFRNDEELTQQDIKYSIKIGKQVIQSKLKEAKAINAEKRNKINEQIANLIDFQRDRNRYYQSIQRIYKQF